MILGGKIKNTIQLTEMFHLQDKLYFRVICGYLSKSIAIESEFNTIGWEQYNIRL
jgi:hypothetical protein